MKGGTFPDNRISRTDAEKWEGMQEGARLIRSVTPSPAWCGARQLTATLVLVAYAKEHNACPTSCRAGPSNLPSVLQPVL